MPPCIMHIPLGNPNKVKDTIYDDLDIIISATPRTIKFFLLGVHNARVGADHQTLTGVMALEGVGKCKSNGDSCYQFFNCLLVCGNDIQHLSLIFNLRICFI